MAQKEYTVEVRSTVERHYITTVKAASPEDACDKAIKEVNRYTFNRWMETTTEPEAEVTNGE